MLEQLLSFLEYDKLPPCFILQKIFYHLPSQVEYKITLMHVQLVKSLRVIFLHNRNQELRPFKEQFVQLGKLEPRSIVDHRNLAMTSLLRLPNCVLEHVVGEQLQHRKISRTIIVSRQYYYHWSTLLVIVIEKGFLSLKFAPDLSQSHLIRPIIFVPLNPFPPHL